MPTLSVSNLTKSFDAGDRALSVLRDVSFTMGRAQASNSLAVTGPSGSGKSTLLHIIGTLDRPSSGSVVIEGEDPFTLEERDLARFRNRVIGFIFQDHHLLPQYTVLENVLLPTLAFPESEAGDEGRARDLLERVGLVDRLGHRPAELSGGERQRVAVARALINRPSLLLCDEPTGSLDHATATSVALLLMQMHQAEGNLLIVVTHSPELAERMSRRVELRDGRCVEA